MRIVVAFFILLCSISLLEAQTGAAVGDWVSLKATTMVGPQTIEVKQRHAIVGEEKDAEGKLLWWFETQIDMGGQQILTKLLVPASAFGETEVSSAQFNKSARRWITKMGDQPAVELPVEEAMKQFQGMMGLAEDPNAKVTELGEEEIETPKGKMKCTKKGYQGKASMEQAQGPIVMTITNTYDRTIWRTAAVPIVGMAKVEEKGLVEVSTQVPMPGTPPPQPQETHSLTVVEDFGQGAKSAITEEPAAVPAPAPVPAPGK
ncbi:MAG: hypothetical protein IT369_08295 [Candidatus Latescibacteria bacterium]|nr:hypothetical protein [Candidatus Latescibacterota bacterium]